MLPPDNSQEPLPQEPLPHPARLIRRSWFVVGMGLFVILYATLFPFDFFIQSGASWRAVLGDFDWTLIASYALADIPRNVVLFAPLGFGLGGLLLARRWRLWPACWLALLVGLMLSALLEVVQAVALLRFPTVPDVLANGLGTAVGCAILYRWGGQMWGGVGRLAEGIRPLRTPRRFFIICLLYLAAWLALAVWLPTTTQLSNWDDQFPLIVGNEQTQDRPWHGVLGRLYLADRAFSDGEVARLLTGENVMAVAGASLVAHYDFLATADANFPPLVPQGSGALVTTPQGILLSRHGWLASEGAVTAVSQALATTSQFTLGLTAASGDVAQGGPARLMSISGDPYRRNLTLGQEGAALVLRLRTPLTGENGRTPEFIIPGVFTNGGLHQIVITYDRTAVRLSIDDPTNVYTIELLPAAALFIKTFPNEVGQMRLNRGNMAVFRLLYTICLFLPWMYWLALLQQHQRLARPPLIFWLVPAIALPAIMWEGLLSLLLRHYQFQPGYAAFNAIVITAGFLLLHWLRLVEPMPALPDK
ncbi:MAG: VanZ family protein [Chloroflexi bacterium]|nr:VanZ family protein [Chloroflexota bacterium]